MPTKLIKFTLQWHFPSEPTGRNNSNSQDDSRPLLSIPRVYQEYIKSKLFNSR